MDHRESVTAAQLKSIGVELASVLPDDPSPWYRRSHLLLLNFCLGSMILFSSANGYDASMMNGLQALPQWQEFMHHPKGIWLGFVNAIQALGSLVGYPICAWVVQRYGRKSGIWIGYLFLILATAMQTVSQNVATFVLARFFIGHATAWYYGSVPLLITECAYPAHRGTITSLFNCGFYVGSLLAAWVTFGTRNMASSWAWRVPSVLQSTLPIMAFLGFFLAPESPRYYVSIGKNEEAKRILAKYHAGGDASLPRPITM